jgi:hypothetical protein
MFTEKELNLIRWLIDSKLTEGCCSEINKELIYLYEKTKMIIGVKDYE